ncbi:MAG TPA: carboxypeptidase regulatory-like domain-containing protein, partial [Thermoanaerobaculia bacterium]|nr:carboxypeptidase regulatory-like domain-containing protein [Thermoanaerobaculia bacterium]
NIFGKVTDKSGGALPGVTITVTGQAAPLTFVTDSHGQFHFVNLSPGTYVVSGELSGFGKVQRQVDVAVGANTEVNLRLDPAVSESITVSAASPVIDTRQVTDGANIEQTELKEVPTARDPWVVLQSVPGVLVDRVNVGGNASGQQSYFVGKGVERNQTVWNVDGIESTDMSGSGGAAGFYFDFDSFQEFNVVTGSADPSVATPGVQLNMVTKRGTNEWQGSGRYFWTGHQLQTSPQVPAEGKLYDLNVVNSIDQINELGVEAGGPILADRVWIWGAYSRNPINNVISGSSAQYQKTDLQNVTGKINAQLASNNAGFLSYMYNNKTVDHRGISPNRPVETSQNQTGPGWQWTLEDTHTFSANMYLTGRVGSIVNGYRLDPVGGMNNQLYYDADEELPHGSYYQYHQSMPMKQANLEGANFFSTGTMNHELKYGFGYRRTPVESSTVFPGDQTYLDYYLGEIIITRQSHPKYGSNYQDLWAGDTITTGNLTLNIGARYDMQSAKNRAVSVPGNPAFPDILPGATFNGDTRSLKWNGLAPRLAATYALGSDKRTVLRASYSRYIDQLNAGGVGSNNPFYLPAYEYFYWYDLNGDNKFQKNELGPFDVAFNVDPDNPAAGFSTGRVDYNMKPPRTDEFVIGASREIGTGFAVGVNYTHRKRSDLIWTVYEKTRGAGDFYTPADFVPAGTVAGTYPNGQSYSVPYYKLASSVPAPLWQVTTNRPDYNQTYDGLELTATKRMTRNWMMRANITFTDWKQHLGSGAITNGDPTPLLSGSSCSTCVGDNTVASNGGVDGYINSRWAAALNGVYQFPHQIILGAAITARDGYIIPYFRRVNAHDGFGNKNVLVSGFDQFRLDNLYQLDLRVAKTFRIVRGAGLELSADLFNATNQNTVLWRDYRLYTAN